jgi:hypothetical protein
MSENQKLIAEIERAMNDWHKANASYESDFGASTVSTRQRLCERLAVLFADNHDAILAALRVNDQLRLAKEKLEQSETPFYEGMKIINAALASPSSSAGEGGKA